MKKLIACVRKDLQSDYPFLFFFGAYRKNLKSNRKMLGQLAAYAVSLGLLYYLLSRMLRFYDLFAATGEQSLFLAYGLIFYFYFLVMLTLPTIISRLYFSEGGQHLLTLPLTPRLIYTSRLIAVLISAGLIACLTVIPVGIKYGLAEQVTPIFYLSLVLGSAAFAVIIVSVFAWLMTVVMRFVMHLPFAKGLMQAAGLFVTLGFVFAIQFAGSGMELEPGSDPNEQLMLDSAAAFLPLLRMLPFGRWMLGSLVRAGTSAGLIQLLWLLLLAAAVFVFVVLTGSRLYVKGILTEAKRKKKTVELADRAKWFRRRSPVAMLARMELTDLIKTPIYAVNVVLIGVLMPPLMMIPLLRGDTKLPPDLIRTLAAPYLGFNPLSLALAAILGLAVGLLFSAMGNTMVTTITRSKNELWLHQVLPIKISDQIKGRLAAHLIVVAINVAVVTGLILYFLNPPIYLTAVYLLGVMFSGVLMGFIGLLLDLIKPKLNWDNPQQAVKQNMNVFVLMIGTMILSAGLVYGTYTLLSKFRVEAVTFLLIAAAVMLLVCLACAVLYRICLNLFARKLPRFGK